MKTKLLLAFVLAQFAALGQTTTPFFCQAEFDGGSTPKVHYISSFTFGNFTNTSSTVQQPFPHYIFYNNLSPGPFRPGWNYAVSVDVDIMDDKHLDIFIDLNRDGFMDPVTERMLSVPVSAGTANITGNITIPITTHLGMTRLRIVLYEDAAYAFSPACFTSLDWGETEDYQILIELTSSITENEGIPAIYTYGNTVYLPEDLNAEKMNIYSPDGRMLLVNKLNGESTITVDIPKGIYLIGIQSGFEWLHRKLIIQ